MPRLAILTLAAAASLAAPVAAQSSFADHSAIDAAVERFTGAPAGAPGGASTQVDRRMRLARCSTDLALAYHGNRFDTLSVACPDAGSWRIFVALNVSGAPTATATARMQPPPEIVGRGDMVSIVVEGPGFAVQQAGEALEGGAIGEWIRVRPAGTRETLRARVEQSGRVVVSRM